MPKETIATADPDPVIKYVTVGWERDRHVQIDFTVSERVTLAVEGEEYDTLFTGMGPDELDRLVRILRRARRQAYGHPPRILRSARTAPAWGTST